MRHMYTMEIACKTSVNHRARAEKSTTRTFDKCQRQLCVGTYILLYFIRTEPIGSFDYRNWAVLLAIKLYRTLYRYKHLVPTYPLIYMIGTIYIIYALHGIMCFFLRTAVRVVYKYSGYEGL